MRTRVKDLHDQYCAPRPNFYYQLWDSEKSMPADAESPEAIAERESINIYCHLVI